MADPTAPTAAVTASFPVDAVYEGDLADQKFSTPIHTQETEATNTAGTGSKDGENSRPQPSERFAQKDEHIVSQVSADSDSKQDLEAGPLEEKNVVHDPDVVTWDGPDDLQNPMNWSSRKKWSNVVILSILTFLSPLASSMFAPAVPQVLAEFNIHNDLLATWVVSVYILGFAFGPFVCAPLSEMYGRVVVYNSFNVLFFIFTLACALAQNMSQLIVFRFFAGCFGISPISNGGASIADMIPPEGRGAAMSIWSIGPLLGPVVGPIIGGFLGQSQGWRWIFWLLAIMSGVSTIACFAVARETYAPVILERKTVRLRRETNNPRLRSALDLGISHAALWKRSFIRPIKLMTLSLICASMSLYVAVVYGILYLFFTTFTFVFEGSYHFAPNIVGLVYLGLGIGMFFGLALLGASLDRLSKHLASTRNNGTLKPEYRLPILIFFGPLMPIGLLIYGWTAQTHQHWALPIFGTLLFGIGLMAAFMCIITYLVDAFHVYAASAVAANTVLRCILGACFPLFGLQMYDSLGLGWGNSLLAFLGVGLCAIPVVFWRWGETVRTSPRWHVEL